MNIFEKKNWQNAMLIGHNNILPIVATAMSETAGKWPIIHAVLCHDNGDDKRRYYLEFQVIAEEKNDPEQIKYYKQELMKHVCEETNLDLPWKIADKFYTFYNNEIIPGKKYGLIPYAGF